MHPVLSSVDVHESCPFSSYKICPTDSVIYSSDRSDFCSSWERIVVDIRQKDYIEREREEIVWMDWDVTESELRWMALNTKWQDKSTSVKADHNRFNYRLSHIKRIRAVHFIPITRRRTGFMGPTFYLNPSFCFKKLHPRRRHGTRDFYHPFPPGKTDFIRTRVINDLSMGISYF